MFQIVNRCSDENFMLLSPYLTPICFVYSEHRVGCEEPLPLPINKCLMDETHVLTTELGLLLAPLIKSYKPQRKYFVSSLVLELKMRRGLWRRGRGEELRDAIALANREKGLEFVVEAATTKQGPTGGKVLFRHRRVAFANIASLVQQLHNWHRKFNFYS